MQKVVKHLIENPKDVEVFQKDPEAFFIEKGFVGGPIERAWIDFIHLVFGPVSYNPKYCNMLGDDFKFNNKVQEVIKNLNSNKREMLAFQADPQLYLKKYDIDANAHLAERIISSVALDNQHSPVSIGEVVSPTPIRKV